MRNRSTAIVSRPLAVCAVLLITACDDRPSGSIVSPDGPTFSTAPGRTTPHPRNAAALAASTGIAGFGTTPIHGGIFGMASSHGGIIVHNTVVQLGVNPEGHLNVEGFVPSFGAYSTTYVGLRYFNRERTVDGASEATAPGCLCEGWGIADATEGVAGYANEDSDGGATNLEVVSFTHTTASVVSTVLVRHPDGRPWMRVTHDYHPSPATRYLYEATVTVENMSSQDIPDLRYRRVMDWDIAPNTFSEYVTIQGTSADNVLFASNDGFASANPLSSRSDLGNTGDFVDSGPADHGALFDFGFGALPALRSKTFTIFYGAAGTESDANRALANVGAEIYSFGQADYDPLNPCDETVNQWFWKPAPNVDACPGTYGRETGEPHTFIFAFRSVGGDPIFKPLDLRLHIMPTPMGLARTDAIAVWVPSTDSFDATKLNPSSATLGNESDPEAAIAQRAGTPWADVADFNRDGRPDMLLVFLKPALTAVGDLSTSTTKLVMRASHAVEGLVRAEGAVRVVP